MNLDLCLLGIVVVSGVLGVFSGAIKQLAHWAGLALAYLAASPLAARLTPWAAPRLGVPAAGVKIGATILGFFALYAVTGALLQVVFKAVAGTGQKGRWDRVGGFALGLGRGALIVYLPVAAALTLEAPIAKALGRSPDAFETSAVFGLVRRHNLFKSVDLPALAKVEKLAQAVRDPQAARALLGDSRLQDLLKDANLKAALKDDALLKALESGDLSSLRKDPRISALLKDPRIAGLAEEAKKLGLDKPTPP